MKRLESRDFVKLLGAALLALAAAGCQTKQVAVAPPPPPPVVIPPQPRPPLGAPVNLAVPALDPATGARHMVNSGISPAQTVWNLRSAYNVAALDCMRPEHAAILTGYKAFLKTNAKRLTAINKQVDTEFAAVAKGRAAVRAREAYMTQVYNFYALPPTLPAFCDAALAMSTAATGLSAKALDAFAVEQLPLIDQVFVQFYDSYDQYRADLAAWRALYAPTSPPADAAAVAGSSVPGSGAQAATTALSQASPTPVTLPN